MKKWKSVVVKATNAAAFWESSSGEPLAQLLRRAMASGVLNGEIETLIVYAPKNATQELVLQKRSTDQ